MIEIIEAVEKIALRIKDAFINEDVSNINAKVSIKVFFICLFFVFI